jgi:transcriptional regulator with XRE-family HTH domain
LELLYVAAGRELRRARVEAGFTLQGVKVRSGARFKPSAVGAYERGERAISLDRFIALANIYGLPADRLLARVMERVDRPSTRVVVLDERPPKTPARNGDRVIASTD